MINFDIIGDLESCPCGSNKEFVNCCKKNISNSKSINTEFINDKQITNWMWKKYNSANVLTCLHPNQLECKKPISGAHALQENGVLSKLAVDNHVNIISYHLQAKKQNITFNAEEEIRNIRLNGSKRYKEELNELLRGMDENQLEILNLRIKGEVEICALKYKVEKKGKNEATKFTGFCNYHDTQIFMPIETHEYKEEIQQDFLFAYRAFAQEYHEKLKNDYKNTFKQNPSLYNETKFVLDYRYRQLDKYYIDKIKETFDKAIINEEYDLFETIRIKFPHPYDFAVTAMIAPEIDLNGNILNDVFSLDKNIRKSFYLTIFPSKTKPLF